MQDHAKLYLGYIMKEILQLSPALAALASSINDVT
jgi:hypothetical protein